MSAQVIAGAEQFVLQSAIGEYSDEAYTNARKLSGTAIVSSNPDIDKNTETFIGQVRWFKPLNPVINVASLTDATDGTKTDYSSDFLKYIKTVRTHGAEKVNMQKVVSRQDGLAKIGRDFGETKAQDEHNAILSVLKGVALSEVLNGAGATSGGVGKGGQTFDNDPADKGYGFYVDLGASGLVGAATTTSQGAQRAEGFLQSIGMGWKDYELPYYYLVVTPATIASLRSANLVDQTTVTEGNVEFNTIFQGKFRLILTRANQGFTSAELTKLNSHATAPAIVGTKTSFIVAPGAVAMEDLEVPDVVEITRDGNKYQGGGLTSIWYRWGYVLAPAGYNWTGEEEDFPSDADYMSVREADTTALITAATDGLVSTSACFTRKTSSALSLGILPVFHG